MEMYLLMCFLWAIYSMIMRFALNYPTEIWRIIIVFVLNFVFAPIALVIAIVKLSNCQIVKCKVNPK
jgi:hypothetical protein